MSFLSNPPADLWQRVYRHRLFWPVVVLVVMLLANVVYRHDFLSISMLNGHLYGSPVDIVRLAAPRALVAVGMTLVIATGGIDLSVGAVIAITGAMACLSISKLGDQNSLGGVFTALGLGLVVA